VSEVNLFRPVFDEPRERPGFNCRRARLGGQAGSRRLGASLWEVDPGQAAYPYHHHLADEELLFVISGRLELRTPEGRRELQEGDVVAFGVGEAGAHQLINRTAHPVRFLAVSTSGTPDITLYPDSGKVGASERRPDGGGLRLMFREGDALDYWADETPPEGSPPGQASGS
jgi:uncharacterized cupin superfamily protein